MLTDGPSLKIAIVSTQREWYGGEQQVWLLAQGLRRRGHEVHILARRGGRLAERMKGDGFAVGRFAGNGRNPLALWQIRRQLRRLRPDVLQYNDPHALTAAGLASCGLKIPVRIVMRHVLWPIRSPWRFRAFSDRVVCVSSAVAEACRTSGLPYEMLRVVHAATDPDKARSGNRQQGRRAAGVDEDRPMLLAVAGLNENKGHAFLLDAFAAVLARHPTARLVLAGDGPLREHLQSRCVQLKMEGSVGFLGYRRDVPDLMQAADLLVLPSLAEGLPVTLLDAMFAGVPIVATAVGGVVDLLGSDGLDEGTVPIFAGTGTDRRLVAKPWSAKMGLSPLPRSTTHDEPAAWTVPPSDSAALAAAILDALDDPQQRALRAQRARRRAEREFTADRMVEAMLELYRGKR